MKLSRCVAKTRGLAERELSLSQHYYSLNLTLTVDVHFAIGPELTVVKNVYEVWCTQNKQLINKPCELFPWLGHFGFEDSSAILTLPALTSLKAFLNEEASEATASQRRSRELGQSIPQS